MSCSTKTLQLVHDFGCKYGFIASLETNDLLKNYVIQQSIDLNRRNVTYKHVICMSLIFIFSQADSLLI